VLDSTSHFDVGCPLRQLWISDLRINMVSDTAPPNSRCPSSSVGSFTLIDNRTSAVTVVCYDGTAPGSAAVIVCDQSKGCAPNTTVSERSRVCQTDTTWSGHPGICCKFSGYWIISYALKFVVFKMAFYLFPPRLQVRTSSRSIYMANCSDSCHSCASCHHCSLCSTIILLQKTNW